MSWHGVLTDIVWVGIVVVGFGSLCALVVALWGAHGAGWDAMSCARKIERMGESCRGHLGLMTIMVNSAVRADSMGDVAGTRENLLFAERWWGGLRGCLRELADLVRMGLLVVPCGPSVANVYADEEIALRAQWLVSSMPRSVGSDVKTAEEAIEEITAAMEQLREDCAAITMALDVAAQHQAKPEPRPVVVPR